MRKLSADSIFPIASPPIKNGVVITDDSGVILDLLPNAEGLDEVEYFEGIICPGFVNTHCHLELSHLKGLLPEKQGLLEFLKPLISLRYAEKEVVEEAMHRADEEMLLNGIVAVGDISNDASSFMLKAASKMRHHTFIEIFNLNPENAAEEFSEGEELCRKATELGLPASVTPHAPYTVSPALLEIIREAAAKGQLPISIHNQENADEDLFFIDGTGVIASIYSGLGLNIDFYKPSGKSSLQTVLPLLAGRGKIQLVHNTFTSAEDIASATHSEIYWCFCPNANLYIEGKVPNFELFEKAAARITIGTDSLASNRHLSVLEELKTITAHAPHIRLEELLTWGTKNGAEFLGFDEKLGTLEKGKQPGLNLLRNFDGGKITAATSVESLPGR